MIKKISWGIVGILAFVSYWLIYRASEFPVDEQTEYAIMSAIFIMLILGVPSVLMGVLMLIFTGPISLFRRMLDVLPIFLIMALALFIAFWFKLIAI
ncbi:MAG: hypothetical protein J7619_29440 [Dyadobacter sp.]|uniref:hypothetical protein n=1 Tax=Dyadobacter sp. TaxID=1914288 RepID=UPI001B2E28E8|nr:hypothetical protein [Dyadobacter sp.]MBO9616846.1 hypothetical protein [Dyadobacter sp.]